MQLLAYILSTSPTLAQAGMQSSPYDNTSSVLLVVAPKVYELNTLFVVCSARLTPDLWPVTLFLSKIHS